METLEIPTIIESKSEYLTALNTVSALAVKGTKRTREEDKLFRTWVLLIEEYEQRRRDRKLKKLPPHELLKFLIDENRLNQKSFEPAVPQSRMSDILNGNRPISNAQAVLFGRRFQVKSSIFLGLE
ncbi:MAG: helix-turn-helix domain-containing protein [Terriglobia bacterium]